MDKHEYLQKLEKEKQLKELKELLPHKYTKLYPWQRSFVNSINRTCLITAANQVGKSSAQIIKCITWATEKELWPRLWPERIAQGKPITLFVYLYPDKETATTEFKMKWVKEWLPRGRMKNDPKYGWKEQILHKQIQSIEFNSGITVIFKSYSQDAPNLQAISAYAVFNDEELPYKHYPELTARLRATKGYFSMVFTATLAQEEWRVCMEERDTEMETFLGAYKDQISLYKCMKFEDGTPSQWTEEYIEEVKRSYGTDAEILRRVYGKFVKDTGLVFPAFNRKDNVISKLKQKKLPDDWPVYAGIDIGSGGKKGHPSAICFVKINPEFTKGYVIKMWRGDGIQTTATDVLQKYREMKKGLDVTQVFYDWASAEFGIIANRMGEPVTMANKSKEEGIQLVNTLFRNLMLKIHEDEETIKLINELLSLGVEAKKTTARDDAIDSMKYAITSIPWDFSCINDAPVIRKDETKHMSSRDKIMHYQDQGLRSDQIDQRLNEQIDTISNELSEWAEYFDDEF